MVHWTLLHVLLWNSFSVRLSYAVTHKLQYIHTAVTPGINLPEYTDVGLVDGEPFVYYDSNIKKYVPKTEWIKITTDDDPDYWSSGTQIQNNAQEIYKADVITLMSRFNQTEGVHTLQRMYGCELHDNGTVRGYEQLAYDGEDFISLDLEHVTWTAVKPQALITKNKLNTAGAAHFEKFYLENICIKWLQKYVSYGRETLERKARPEVSVFHKHSSPDVVCHATGFYPKEVMITWQRDGEVMHENVELRETLPNQDGSFQKRIILRVSPEDLQKHNYTCVVQHSSLDKEIVKIFLRDGGSAALCIGFLAAVLVFVLFVGFLIWKKKSDFHKFHKPGAPLDKNHNKKSDYLLNLERVQTTYTFSTGKNRVLVQSQCWCWFKVGSTGKPSKNRFSFPSVIELSQRRV